MVRMALSIATGLSHLHMEILGTQGRGFFLFCQLLDWFDHNLFACVLTVVLVILFDR
jgi:hypothetical protein